MTFSIHPDTRPGKVVLKVADLKKLVHYYQEIGLTLLSQNENKASLGSEESTIPLLELIKINHPLPKKRKTGLFHTAFLVPTRRDLGNCLYALLQKKIPIVGASDHGFSEAIYLQDPEGNGIEIYRDKPKSEWDIRENGRIAGITIQMDADGVMAARDESSNGSFPKGTTVGHVHLSVAHLTKTEGFYTQILGLEVKDYFGEEAIFFAAGEYHHHIGANIWQSKEAPEMNEDDTGLAYFTLQVPDQTTFNNIVANIKEANILALDHTEHSISVKDPNGIIVKIEGPNKNKREEN